jgi:hypothetical protein
MEKASTSPSFEPTESVIFFNERVRASTLKQGAKPRNWPPVRIEISRLTPICCLRRENASTFFVGGREDERAITYTGRRAAKVDSLLDE